MRSSRSRVAVVVVCVTALAMATAACGDDETSAESTAPVATVAGDEFRGDLVGTFAIDGGLCSDGLFIGSVVRFAAAGDTADTGPYLANADSPCTDQTFTALVPGTDGGLRTATFQ